MAGRSVTDATAAPPTAPPARSGRWRGLQLRPRDVAIAIIGALVLGAVIFLLADRDRTIRLTGETMQLSLTTLRADDFTFEMGEAVVLLPAASPARAAEARAVSGALYLQGPARADISFDPVENNLTLVFSAAEGPVPRIGEQDIPFGAPVVIGRAEMQRISVLRAAGSITLGQPARSNSTAHLVQADYSFFERVPGLGEVETLAGSLGRFDMVGFVDQHSGEPIRSDVMIDLTAATLRIWVEAGSQGAAPVLSVQRKLGALPARIGPEWRDRLLANPLFQIATTVLSLILVIGQILSVSAGPSGKEVPGPKEEAALGKRRIVRVVWSQFSRRAGPRRDRSIRDTD